MSRCVAGHLLEIDDLAAGDSELERLTPRGLEVVTLIARGYKYREVATDLGISQKTLESRMRNVFDKLGVASRSEVTHSRPRDRVRIPRGRDLTAGLTTPAG